MKTEMKRIVFSAGRRVAAERSGMALVEVLISMAIFSFVLMGVLGLLDASAKSAPADQERSTAMREVQSGLAGMVRELRQAYRVVGTSPSSMTVLVRVRGDDPVTTTVETHINRLVEYDCGVAVSGKCVRHESRPGEVPGGEGRVVVDRVLNGAQVFSFESSGSSEGADSSPSYVAVRVEVPARGERTGGHRHSVVLEDGFYVRNMDLGS